jgi:hypothetical protein
MSAWQSTGCWRMVGYTEAIANLMTFDPRTRCLRCESDQFQAKKQH